MPEVVGGERLLEPVLGAMPGYRHHARVVDQQVQPRAGRADLVRRLADRSHPSKVKPHDPHAGLFRLGLGQPAGLPGPRLDPGWGWPALFRPGLGQPGGLPGPRLDPGWGWPALFRPGLGQPGGPFDPGPDELGGPLGLVQVAAGEYDRGAPFGQNRRRLQPETAAGPGHHRGPSGLIGHIGSRPPATRAHRPSHHGTSFQVADPNLIDIQNLMVVKIQAAAQQSSAVRADAGDLWITPRQIRNRRYGWARCGRRHISGHVSTFAYAISQNFRSWSKHVVITTCFDQDLGGEGRARKGLEVRSSPTATLVPHATLALA